MLSLKLENALASNFNVPNEISNTEPEKIVHELEGDNLFSHISRKKEIPWSNLSFYSKIMWIYCYTKTLGPRDT